MLMKVLQELTDYFSVERVSQSGRLLKFEDCLEMFGDVFTSSRA